MGPVNSIGTTLVGKNPIAIKPISHTLAPERNKSDSVKTAIGMGDDISEANEIQ